MFPLWLAIVIIFCFCLAIDCENIFYYCDYVTIINLVLCICWPQTPNSSFLLLTLPLNNHKSVLYVCESISVS